MTSSRRLIFLATLILAALILAPLMAAAPALAAEGLPGASMSPIWALPFAGLLASIAFGPLLFPGLWHAHYGKIAGFWGLCAALPLFPAFGAAPASHALAHALLVDFVPFILLLAALFTTSGGITIEGRVTGTPLSNCALLGVAGFSASFIGTTGASMIFIRPLLRANALRRHKVHTVVFFIFLVSNVAGALTPLGDPPLFMGFLRGVPFFWPLQNLWRETLLAGGVLLALYFMLDLWLWRREPAAPAPPAAQGLRIHGLMNLPLIGLVVGAILLSGVWKPGVGITVAGAHMPLQNLVREAAMIAVCLASVALTRGGARAAREFSWEPIFEVAKIFAAIFVCLAPMLAMLQAGKAGAFAPLLALIENPDGSHRAMATFWATGVLSAFLDNTPTYLVFFELAGGSVEALTGTHAKTLAAISAGAVFMGALTYIGNAPNFMVYAIARHGGVRMPGFFGYMIWSFGILLPFFALIGWLFYA